MEIKTNEEALELAEDYATFYLIKRYLDIKDIKALESLKEMIHKSIQKKKEKESKPIGIPIQNEKSSILDGPLVRMTDFIGNVKTIKKRISF